MAATEFITRYKQLLNTYRNLQSNDPELPSALNAISAKQTADLQAAEQEKNSRLRDLQNRRPTTDVIARQRSRFTARNLPLEAVAQPITDTAGDPKAAFIAANQRIVDTGKNLDDLYKALVQAQEHELAQRAAAARRQLIMRSCAVAGVLVAIVLLFGVVSIVQQNQRNADSTATRVAYLNANATDDQIFALTSTAAANESATQDMNDFNASATQYMNDAFATATQAPLDTATAIAQANATAAVQTAYAATSQQFMVNATLTQAPLDTASAVVAATQAPLDTATARAQINATASQAPFATMTARSMQTTQVILDTQTANANATQLQINEASGHIFFLNADNVHIGSDGNTVADSFSVHSMRMDGSDNQQLFSDTISADLTTNQGLLDFAYSPNGRSIAYAYGDNTTENIIVADADNTNSRIITDDTGKIDSYPSWSPDGRQVAFESKQGGDNGTYYICTVNTDGTNEQCLTSSDVNSVQPCWSPDGQHIIYSANYNIWVMDADGSSKIQLTNTGSDTTLNGNPSWSLDGTKIAYNRTTLMDFFNTSSDVYVMNADGSNAVLLATNASFPSWSPDSRIIVFTSGPATNGGTPVPNILSQIQIINVDGTNRHAIYNNGLRPEWINDADTISP